MTDSSQAAPASGPLVRDISDTALWVAVYRARESERPDALFRDPLARRLAGERGEQIAHSPHFSRQDSWPYVARTWRFDQIIAAQIAQGTDMVVNLAAGLDARPYRMELPAGLQWIEVDLPAMIDYKEQALRGEKPRCALERVRLDLSDVAARQELFSDLGARAKQALIVTEGLLVYLSPEEVRALGQDLAAQPGFQDWAIDLASPGLLKMLQKNLPVLSEAGSPLKFGPEEGPGFFTSCGWKPADVYSMLKTAAKIGRLSLGMRLLSLLPEPTGRQGSRPWGGVCRLTRM